MDRISELPDGIIQYILSFLPAEEVVQTSILSKTWLHQWCTIPDLDFSHRRICQKHSKTEDWYNHSRDEQLRDKFIKLVDNTLQRHNLCINKCKFLLYIAEKELASSVDKWLEIVVAKDVKHLSLLLPLPYPEYKYTLPQTIFTANSMISLEVHGDGYGDQMVGFKLCDHQLVKKCYTLKKLYLYGIKVSKSTIRSLSSIFPCIEELTLYKCSMTEIKLSNLPNLKIFYVKSIHSLTVDITEAHSLQSFTYFSYGYKHDLEQYFNIFPCQSLKSLSMTDSSIRSVSLSNLLSQCTSLEELELTTCNSLEWIKISSTSLKSFKLTDGERLKEIKIDAPNLSILDYTNSIYPSFSLTSRSEDLESSLDLVSLYSVSRDDYLDTSFFTKLRGILAQIRPSKFSLTVSMYDKIILDIDELRKVSALDPNPKLQNLGMELCIYTLRLERSTYSTFLDGLFWSTCLKSLTVRHTEDEQVSLKSLCEELMERRTSPECCDTNQTMCWRHQLNHVDVEYMEDDDESIKKWHHLDWKSWIDGSYTFVDTCEVYIRFTFNWYVVD